MSTQLGRISGALLKDNLLRDGVDLAFENDLIYLDINNLKIGIKTSSPTRDLQIDGDTKTTNLITNQADIADIEFINSNISTLMGDLIVTAATSVSATRIGAGNIEIDNNKIYTTVTNQDLELQLFDPTNKVKTFSNTEIIGNLYTTGDVTLGGNIIIGSDSSDSVIFASDIDSNIVPDQHDVYYIGESVDRRWNNIYAGLLNGLIISAGTISPGSGIFPEIRQGNIWYVAVNGDDTNVGNHQNGPFSTIEKSLSVAIDGDMILIYPGEYEETLPLVIPKGVTVKGIDIRNTVIKPDTSSTNKDVFLLNGETTVSDITIKDYYYDSINDTGYAFRFAPGFKVTTRSPYIQNVTVITKGSVTSVGDPRGFLSGDAGRGILLDGIVADIQTNEASCLFSAVTLITPGVDALIMTNGVRVEWLNCFTYFANRGMYAISGIGRTIQDGSTQQYGAEVRSIGSCNVYGNYGTVADGLDTLMYLIDHNFAYIGTGKDSSNNKLLAISDNEVLELNTGQIHFTSTDHTGIFRVGDVFYVDIENNTTTINTSGVTASSIVGLNIVNGSTNTFTDAAVINIENISIHNNTVESLLDEINIASASNQINLQDNTFMQQTLSMVGNFVIGGNLNLGNDDGDTIIILPEIEENIEPAVDNIYNLGSTNKKWKDIYTRTAQIADINIDTNVIKTTISNSDLELKGNSAGGVITESIRFYNTAIEAVGINQNIEITISGTSVVNINTDTSMILPKGSTIPIGISGNMRFNTTESIFTGQTTASTAFAGVYSDNRLTSAFATPTSNELIFLITPIQAMNVDSNRTFVQGLTVDNITVNNNTISTNNINLNLTPDGTATVDVFNIRFNNAAIENTSAFGKTTIAHSGTGYLKFNGTTGIVIPAGGDLDRPGSPDQGVMRWSTDQAYLEIYIGTSWSIATSSGAGFASVNQIQELGDLYSLILG